MEINRLNEGYSVEDLKKLLQSGKADTSMPGK
jgi:hypothetical protein